MSKKRKKATGSKIRKKRKSPMEKKPTPTPVEPEPKIEQDVGQKEAVKPEPIKSDTEGEEKPVPMEKKPESIPEEEEVITPEEKKDEEDLKEEIPEELIGELEFSILKDLKEKDQQEYNQELSDNNNIEERFKEVKELADQLPDGIKQYEDDFKQIIEKNKQEFPTEGVSEDLKVKLDNRQESIDLCLKMITNLPRFFPHLETLKENVTKVTGLNNYEWGDDGNYKDTSKKEFQDQKAQLEKEIESVRNNNYHVVRQKRESVEQYKKFFFDFFNRHFFSIIDGLDRGKTFYKENKSEWMENYADFKNLIEARYIIYDSLLEVTFNLLNKFHIKEIPVKEGEEFNEKIHEPFMVEEDANMEPDKIIIKEINSRGFKFKKPDATEEIIIRPPQVIVVKKS
jgi:molecular chaperone GrpE (heat shock protein)